MNDTTLISIPDGVNVATLFAEKGRIEKIVTEIEKAARSEVSDVATKAGREAITSLAFKVARSKTTIDEAGKALNAERLALNKEVNDQRNLVTSRLDALRDEIRSPLEQFQAKEEVRKAMHTDAIEAMKFADITEHSTSDEINAALVELSAVELGDDWEEFEEFATDQKVAAKVRLDAALVVAVQREADQAELKALRDAAAEREAQDAARDAARLAEQQAEQKARDDQREVDAAEARRVMAELERASQEKIDAANAQAAEAQSRLDEIASKEREREQAEQEEADRIASEEAAEATRLATKEAEEKAAADKIAADQQVTKEIFEALEKLGATTEVASNITDAIVFGEIPHVGITA